MIGSKGSVAAAMAAMDCSSAALQRVVGESLSITEMSSDDLVASIVIPRLSTLHEGDSGARLLRTSTAAIWHAERDSGAKLASVLIAAHSWDSRRYVDSLLDQGANLNALYHEVFEPAQLQLGKLWDDHRCDDFRLSVGLARLQMEIRRVNAVVPSDPVAKSNHHILLCSQPSESHCVGLVMSSEVFDRQGWDVDCEFPLDDETLNDVLRAHWFDVLKVSQSGSLRRDGRLASMRTTIDSARSASLNPALIVMVEGRTFVERPEVYRAVHANAMSTSVLDGVSVAEGLLAASRSLVPQCQVS